MHPTLADLSSVEPTAIKDWLLILGFFVGLAGGIIAMLRRVPQPLRTQEETQYASADGVRALAARVEIVERIAHSFPAVIEKEMRALERSLAQAGEVRAADIHDRINPLAKEIHELRGAVTEVTRLLHEISTRQAPARKP